MHILFLGNFLPAPLMENVVRDSRGKVSFSNHIYEWNILKSLSGREDVHLQALTVPGVGSWPKGNRHLFTSSYRTEENGIPVQSIGFCNIWPFFAISRQLHLQRKLRKVLRSYDGEPVEILLSAPAYYTQLALRNALKKVHPAPRVTIILPDIPVIMDEMAGSSGLRGCLLHRMAVRSMKLLQAYRRFILLTAPMRDFIPAESETLVMEGLVDEKTVAAPDPVEAPVIAYTGVVDRQFGLGVLVDAFSRLTVPGAELWICGSGPMARELERLAAQMPAIHYEGLVSPEEAARIRASARILVNPRTSEGRFTRYSFPSKTLEYLATGKPVVANMLPGIPEEYRPYLIVPKGEDAASLATALDDALRLLPDEISSRSVRTRSFLLDYKTTSAQGQEILKFLSL